MCEYLLMWKDMPVFSFDTEAKFGHVVAPKLLPYGMKNPGVCYGDLVSFASGRVLQTNRKYFKEIVTSCGIDDQSDLNIFIASKGLSFRDNYWVKKADSLEKWEDVNLYNNAFSSEISYTALTGETCSVSIGDALFTGELTGKGTRAKCFVREGSGIYLVKAETDREIASEVVSQFVATALGLPATKYAATKYAGLNTSVCQIGTSSEKELIPCADILRYFGGEMSADSKYYEFFMQKAPVNFLKMQIFDYVTLNTDRNRDNFALLRENGVIKGLFPIYDHDSCFKGKSTSALYFVTKKSFSDSLEFLKERYGGEFSLIEKDVRNLHDYLCGKGKEIFDSYGLSDCVNGAISRTEDILISTKEKVWEEPDEKPGKSPEDD